MVIDNVVYRVPAKRDGIWLESLAASLAPKLGLGTHPLRLSIVAASLDEVVIECTAVRYHVGERHADALGTIEMLEPRRKQFQADPFCAVQVIPTGIRCELGGFAGDACPVTNLLASTVDALITHPNAVNASELNEMASNVLYVEGRSLDDFLLGHIGLLPVAGNRVGTFVDPTGLAQLDHVVNALDAGVASCGFDCGLYTLLDDDLGARVQWGPSGSAVGTVEAPQAVVEAAETLLTHGAQAVGGVSVIHGVTKEMFSRHQRGEIPNPSGGVEAIISHLVSKLLRVPTAHAPLPYYQERKPRATKDPRVAAEMISTPHYVSVLRGLARAPRLATITDLSRPPAQLLTANNVGAIVMPASCLGGVPAMAGEHSGIPVVAVAENSTILEVTNDAMRMDNVIEVGSYLEAVGVLVSLREGIPLRSLRRPLGGARRVDPALRRGLTSEPSGDGRVRNSEQVLRAAGPAGG